MGEWSHTSSRKLRQDLGPHRKQRGKFDWGQSFWREASFQPQIFVAAHCRHYTRLKCYTQHTYYILYAKSQSARRRWRRRYLMHLAMQDTRTGQLPRINNPRVMLWFPPVLYVGAVYINHAIRFQERQHEYVDSPLLCNGDKHATLTV